MARCLISSCFADRAKAAVRVFIVDSQVHIWKEEAPDRPWVPGARERIRLNGHREEPFSHEECLALMDEARVPFTDCFFSYGHPDVEGSDIRGRKPSPWFIDRAIEEHGLTRADRHPNRGL